MRRSELTIFQLRPRSSDRERTQYPQPRGRRRDPERNRHQRTSEDGQGESKLNGRVYYFRPAIDRTGRPRQPRVHQVPDAARSAGTVRLPLWPEDGDGRHWTEQTFRFAGDRTFNFEALFINAFNHRNTVVGNTNGATVSIDSTTFGQTTGTSTGSRD